MKRKYTVISSITLGVIFLALIVIFLIFPKLNGQIVSLTPTLAQTPTLASTSEPMPTEIAYSEDDYKIFKQIDFETEKNLNYFDLLGEIEEELSEQEVTQKGAIIENGSAIFGQFPVRGANLLPHIVYDVGVHIRWKIASENTCESFTLAPFTSQENQMIEAYRVGVGGCSYQLLQTELLSDYSEDFISPFDSQGSIVMDDGKWMDAVFWIERGQSAHTLKLFAWETENPLIYYSEKRELSGLEAANMFLFSFQVFDGSIAVDFFKMISGDLESYLWFTAPAFKQNNASIVDLYNSDLVAQVSAVEFETQKDDSQQAELQNKPVIENQVLTWPEPEAILPYLVNYEEIERCANCETTVYGVDLSPMGYIFSVSFGYPPDSANTPRSDFIKQRIQLFTEPINKVELFQYYKLISRIMPYKAGEPISIIYKWANAESNLMGIKSNVLTIATASNGANNYRIAYKITEDTLAKLPDEGILTPEMVAEPSLKLNEVAAENILDDVWLANFDAPLKPVNSLNGRVNLYVRLKAPVEKIEAAIYHPASQTYLTYSWIDNPPVDTEIGMTGLVSTQDTKSPDDYYLGNYKGTFLVRIWADGQLIREFQIGG